jgi:hypothetical protein
MSPLISTIEFSSCRLRRAKVSGRNYQPNEPFWSSLHELHTWLLPWPSGFEGFRCASSIVDYGMKADPNLGATVRGVFDDS